ncbi:MAG: helix-turn-helix domain-containing protein [Firmicutes bacterium]|nr:helix-turn-helix domain-containing protein [Bacillota bacterium]
MEIVSIRLKEERLCNGLTQKKLAQMLDIPLRAYQNYEAIGKNHREPDCEMLVRISTALNITIDYLLGKEN